MADSSRNCPSCGAHVPDDSDHCDLCGTPVADDTTDERASDPEHEEPSGPATESEAADEADEMSSGVYCTQCGTHNPADANYCSQCGTELHTPSDAGPKSARPVAADLPEGPSGSEAASEEPAPDAEEAPASAGRQILWMVGVGLCLVLGFFFVTQWSQQYEWGGEEGGGPPAAASESGGGSAGPAAGGEGPAAGGMPQGGAGATPETDLESLVREFGGPVEGPVADEIDSLRAVEEETEGEQQRRVRAELVKMYTGAGAPGQAALVQRQLADATESVEDRRRAADLLYRWMRQVEQQQGRKEVLEVARHVATAYETVANERPEDLDARTRMGEAYLLTNNPMKGIRAINDVLDADSTFVPARFQKGLALLQINRLDQALEQFQQVREYAEEGQPFYKQAGRAIDVIEKQRAKSGSASTGTGS
jgi:ribosomal protein L40E/thioredoxin-like negative regulator of GroEL